MGVAQEPATAAGSLSTASVLPVVDIGRYLNSQTGLTPEKEALCRQVAEIFKTTGCLVVRDPRVDHSENDSFIDVMEAYFGRTPDQKMAETRPELSFQVGYTPEAAEVPRAVQNWHTRELPQQDKEIQALVASQPEQHRAILPTGPDVKCRYMWPLRERSSLQFKELNAEKVTPQGIPGWAEQMDSWGNKMLDAVHTVAEMAAVGFGLPGDTFLRKMENAPHILAPTGSNLEKHNQLGTCYAGFHNDLNFVTIHGKSRFPGLFVWLRDGRRVPVAIPDGCLLLQAGQQMEWLTGGAVTAGMHEVVCTKATQAAIETARTAGRSLWRVSSTVFSHIASDQELIPQGQFLTAASKAKYPSTLAGLQVQKELETIRLKSSA